MPLPSAPLNKSAAPWVLVLLFLLALRVPSLVEPAGADQSLYAYVGQRINAGDVPYRDAWDQKPPAIHFLYAALWRVWPHESVVAAADLVAAAFVAALLLALGRRTFGAGAGATAAAVFLTFGNPAIQRLSGVRVRAQCETFIAVAVTAALVLAARRERRPGALMLAGVFLGVAFWLKYNAGIYLVPALLSAALIDPDVRATRDGLGRRILLGAAPIALGFSLVCAAFLAYFAVHGALTDLGLATVTYNLQYSGETYAGLRSVFGYLTFPLDRARLDFLWYLGGIGVVLLVLSERRRPATWMAVAWIAAACVSVAVNGARDLPQYFVQANPALAFAAGAGLWAGLRHRGILLRLAAAVLVSAGLWRVGDEPVGVRLGGLPEAARNVRFDLDYARGRVDRRTYLARFQEQADTKYVPLSASELTSVVRQTTSPSDRILVFGLAASVYVEAPRRSASRFFWSRPVVVEFEAGRSGYGSAGLLTDLQRSNPAIVALQKHWGEPGPEAFFMSVPPLRAWLEAGYVLEQDSSEFAVWRRRS